MIGSVTLFLSSVTGLGTVADVAEPPAPEPVTIFDCYAGTPPEGQAFFDARPSDTNIRPFLVRIEDFQNSLAKSEEARVELRTGFEISDPTDILVGFSQPWIALRGEREPILVLNQIDSEHFVAILIESNEATDSSYTFQSYFVQNNPQDTEARGVIFDAGRLAGSCERRTTQTVMITQ